MIDALARILEDNSEATGRFFGNTTHDTHLGILSPKDAATKAILEKSFLPHMKGISREYCSLGHWLELPKLLCLDLNLRSKPHLQLGLQQRRMHCIQKTVWTL
jgi:hypothetical protein